MAAFFNWEDQKRILDPGGFVWKPKSNAPTEYAHQGQFDQMQNDAFDPASYVTHQQAPQLQMGDDPFRRAQLQQMGQLQGIASGQQQGAGELAAQRQVANAQAAQQAMARMARGGNAALAYRNAANQSAALGSTGAGMGQQAAMQDQQLAHNQLAQVGAQGRQSDIGVANANAGYQASVGQQNAGNYLQLMNQANQRDQNKYNADLGIGAQQDGADAAKRGGLIQGIGSAIAMFSDERLKTDISDARHEVDIMLDGLAPKSYTYKDQKHGEGPRIGIMAQDLERSEAGRRIVHELPEGKALDINKALSAALASSARLHERLKAVEAR